MSERVECDPPASKGNGQKCGHTDLQGFDVVLECVRPPHDDDKHRTAIGQRWDCGHREDIYCPFSSDGACPAGLDFCPTMRERMCTGDA